MSAEHPATAMTSRTNRTKAGNGSRILNGVDLRSARGRRLRELVADYAGALGRTPLPHERPLLLAVASHIVELEEMTAKAMRGEPVDMDARTRSVNALCRLLAGLGIESPDSKAGRATGSLADMAARFSGASGAA